MFNFISAGYKNQRAALSTRHLANQAFKAVEDLKTKGGESAGFRVVKFNGGNHGRPHPFISANMLYRELLAGDRRVLFSSNGGSLTLELTELVALSKVNKSKSVIQLIEENTFSSLYDAYQITYFLSAELEREKRYERLNEILGKMVSDHSEEVKDYLTSSLSAGNSVIPTIMEVTFRTAQTPLPAFNADDLITFVLAPTHVWKDSDDNHHHSFLRRLHFSYFNVKMKTFESAPNIGTMRGADMPTGGFTAPDGSFFVTTPGAYDQAATLSLIENLSAEVQSVVDQEDSFDDYDEHYDHHFAVDFWPGYETSEAVSRAQRSIAALS